jgi:hypothetical protein
MLLKRLLFLVLAGCGILGAQTPAAFKYQTVCRDASGLILANQLLGFKLSLLQGSPTGPTVFSETHSSSSNDFGVVNLNVGQGNQMQGNIQNLDWINNSYFLKVEFDPSGQSNYLFMGSSQIMAVPYALNAKHAQQANRSLNDQDTSSSNEIQTLSIVGNQLQISGGNSVTFTGVVDLDPDPTNELQVLQLSNDTLFLSSGNFVVLPPDADGDSTNELQALSLTNDTLFLSSGNFVVLPPDADGDSTNELQALSLTNDTLFLSSGNFVVLPPDADSDSTNELQTLTYANDSLSISLGNTIPLPAKTPWYKAGGTTDAAADKTGNVYRPGSVGIGSNPTPDSSAVLDLNSSNKGFLPPRIALQAKNAATPVSNPAQGLLVYNTATAGNAPNQVSPGYYYWDGVEWVSLGKNFQAKPIYIWDANLMGTPLITSNLNPVPVQLGGDATITSSGIRLNTAGIANLNLTNFDFSSDFSLTIMGTYLFQYGDWWLGIAGVQPWQQVNNQTLNGLIIKKSTQGMQLIFNGQVVLNGFGFGVGAFKIVKKQINNLPYLICYSFGTNNYLITKPVAYLDISNWNPNGHFLGIGTTNQSGYITHVHYLNLETQE